MLRIEAGGHLALECLWILDSFPGVYKGVPGPSPETSWQLQEQPRIRVPFKLCISGCGRQNRNTITRVVLHKHF